MTKHIFLPSLMLILLCIGCKQIESNNTFPDGLYLVVKIDTVATEISHLSPNEKAIFFSDMFDEYNSEAYTRIIIDTTQFVPLELENTPKTEQQSDTKKKLLLSLTESASEKLRIFTANHVMERVVLVVDGEALTMHKIREAITSGQLQISRCNDNACELLLTKLKDNEKF